MQDALQAVSVQAARAWDLRHRRYETIHASSAIGVSAIPIVTTPRPSPVTAASANNAELLIDAFGTSPSTPVCARSSSTVRSSSGSNSSG